MSASPSPQPEPSGDFFRKLEVERINALVARDLEALERLHAPEYELVTPAGVVFTRARYLAAVESEPFYSSWKCGPMSVRVSPSMAVVRYQAELGFPSGRIVRCWHTDTYELQAGQWRAVWSQATGIQPQAAP